MQTINSVPSYTSMAHGASPTGHTYNATQVTNAINFSTGVRRLAWRADLLHSDRSYKSDLTPWLTSLSIVHDTAQPIHRTATLTMAETTASQTVTLQGGVVTSAAVDYLNDLVEIWCGIGMEQINPADMGYALWSQGVFTWKRPGAQVPDFAVVRTAELCDLSYRLQEAATTQAQTNIHAPKPFTLPPGAYLIDVVYGLIVNSPDGTVNNTGIAALNGMPGANIPSIFVNYTAWPSSSTLDATIPASYTFEADTNYLDIANTLLKYLNCYDLWVDENGAFNVTPWPPNQNYTVLPASWTFDTQNNSIIYPGVTEDILLDDIANVVLVKVEDAQRTTFSALAVNNDPASPYSVANWGREVVKEVDDPNVPNTSANGTNWVQLYANQQLIINSYLTDTVTMETAIVPLFQDHDVINLNVQQTDVSSGSAQTAPVIVGGFQGTITAVSAGAGQAFTITPATGSSLTQLSAGAPLIVGVGGTQEVVALTTYNATTGAATATFTQSHAGGTGVTYGLPGLTLSERFLSLKWQIDAVLAEPDAGRNLAGATGYTTMLDTRNTPPASKMTHSLQRVTSTLNPGSPVGGQPANIGVS